VILAAQTAPKVSAHSDSRTGTEELYDAHGLPIVRVRR
jgi:hypothetical protein